jgi:hypothetical protein
LIHDNNEGINIINFEPVFERLNYELSAINQFLEVVCAGGYVMQLHGYRGTADIDAFFESNRIIDNAIRKVGDEFNLNRPDELWLNNSISNKNPKPPTKHCEYVYKFSHLTILKVDITYLMGMKLYSGRGQDLQDVAAILKNNKDMQPLGLFAKLKDIGFYPDVSVILDAFELVNGMDWLMEFYEKHESELQNYY